MTSMEMMAGIIVAIVCFFASVKILSDVISERIIHNRIMFVIISLVLETYSSLTVAILTEYYYSLEFKVIRVCLYAFSIFLIIFGISASVGIIKIKRDEKIILDTILEAQDTVADKNDEKIKKKEKNKIISIEDARKKRKSN